VTFVFPQVSYTIMSILSPSMLNNLWAVLWGQPAITIASALFLFNLIRWGYIRKAMPPGPLGVPWLGNKHELPAVKPWRKFAEWNGRYGEEPIALRYIRYLSVV
jgi:hypothetical protein